MNPSLIWGAILVLLGLSLLLKSILNVTIPLIRPFFGCVFVYLGLSIMMDPFTERPEKKTVVFGTSLVKGHADISTYNVAFGSSTVDLSHLSFAEPTDITINTVFGSQTVLINPAIATKVRVNALFSRAALPDETLLSFGRNVYKNIEHEDPVLTIQMNVLFGNIDVITAQFEPVSIEVKDQDMNDQDIVAQLA
jgi:predicted membrane protein